MALFKIDSKGKVRILVIGSDSDGNLNRMAGVFPHGTDPARLFEQQGIVRTSKPCKPKNVGKINETNAAIQASIQAGAERVKKIREGYVQIDVYGNKSLEEIKRVIEENQFQFPRPMLAKPFESKRMERMLISPKLDGMRCAAEIKPGGIITLWSREGVELEIFQHIENQLIDLHTETGWTGTLDGELYVHSGDNDNFQEIMSACKKYRKGITEQVLYNVYDIYSDKSAEDRWREYVDLLTKDDGHYYSHVVIVDQNVVTDEAVGRELDELFVAEGYEGSMWKVAERGYISGKHHDLMKMKQFEDAEFKVLDVEPMDAWPNCGKFVCETKDGKVFRSTPKGTIAQKEEYLKNKHNYIGKMLTVKFQGYTDDGIPRINVGKGFRLESDLPNN
jgi:ATP-dependent DNA ligase